MLVVVGSLIRLADIDGPKVVPVCRVLLVLINLAADTTCNMLWVYMCGLAGVRFTRDQIA